MEGFQKVKMSKEERKANSAPSRYTRPNCAPLRWAKLKFLKAWEFSKSYMRFQ